jgi:hypothetical protein
VRYEQPDEIGPDFSRKIFEEKISHQKTGAQKISLLLYAMIFFLPTTEI